MDDDATRELLDRLDLLVGVIQLAYAEEIAVARSKLRGDPVTTAILDQAEDWVSARAIQEGVAAAASVSTRTAQRRMSDLVTMRALAMRGSGRAIEYRSTGLI